MFKHKDVINSKSSKSSDPQLVQRLTSENQRLSYEVDMLRNANREKEDTINHLTGYILEKARLKSLIKDLVLKVDAIITLRLTKKLKNKKQYPVISIRKSENDPKKILQAIQQADKKVFLTKPGAFGRLEKLGFRFIYICYRGFRKAGYRSASFVKHVVFG